MQAHEQVEFLQAVGEFVTVQVAKAVELATAPLLQKIDALQVAIDKVPAGKDGRDGRDGHDGQDGEPGADGLSVDADSVNAFIKVCVDDAVARLPVPAVPVGVVGGYIDRDGNLCLTLSDGTIKTLGVVVGRDGADGKSVDPEAAIRTIKEILDTWPKPKDGKDGFGFDNFDVQQSKDDERLVIMRFWRGDEYKSFNIWLHHPLYMDIWKQADYRRGDCVTWAGSVYIALKDTASKPGLPDSDWKLIVKRGQDGKEGKPGKEGPPGKDGRHGRDLTQLGYDGRKY